MADFSIKGLDAQRYLDRLKGPGQSGVGAGTGAGGDFAGFLRGAIDQVNHIQQSADEQFSKVAAGQVEDMHTAMIELQKADLSFQAMMQIRNKIMEAYQEIMRTPV